jgi:hypothetical protein
MSQTAFPMDQAWKTLTALLVAQLNGVDVQEVSDKDFNADGDLIMNPPSVRTYFAGCDYSSTFDNQKLSYDATGKFMLLCAGQNLQSIAAQAHASAQLADQVCGLIAGARITLPSGDISEPITLKSIDPLPVEEIGIAYGVAIEVPGLAQFPGTNAGVGGS